MTNDKHIATQTHTNREKFEECLSHTAQVTGFNESVIEKDYYCSLVLYDLGMAGELPLVFKGGTCLSKVHTNFSRLSEDLDFSISMEISSTQSKRRKKMSPVKEHFQTLSMRLPCFEFADGLTGRNSSRHYDGGLLYQSIISGEWEKIKLDVSLREPVLNLAIKHPAHTLLIDAESFQPLLDGIEVVSLPYHEVYAEKMRAALTRDSFAIRDIYDLEVGIENGLDIDDLQFVELVRKKLSVPNYDKVKLLKKDSDFLATEIETELKSVLKDGGTHRYDLGKTVDLLIRYTEKHGLPTH